MTNQTLGGVVVTDVEVLVGRPFRGLRQNQDITVTGWSNASTFYDQGYTKTYRSIQIADVGGWAAVTAGTWDATLTSTAQNLMALSTRFNTANPALVCFHHETSLDSTQGPTPGVVGTNQEYIDAYRHVRNLFDSLGATRLTKTGTANGGPIEMAYNVWDRMLVGANGIGGPTANQGVDDLDPDKGSSPAPGGTSYYEWFSFDCYNDVQSVGVMKYGTDAATLLGPARTAAVARSKDWFMPEFGCGDGATQADHDNKAAWLDSVRLWLQGASQTSPGVCRLIDLTFKSSAEGYMVDSSPEALAAYRRLCRSEYFAGGLGQGFDTDRSSGQRGGRILPIAY